MTDLRYMEVARAALPCGDVRGCQKFYIESGGQSHHHPDCRAYDRPAVAAAIQVEVERATREATKLVHAENCDSRRTHLTTCNCGADAALEKIVAEAVNKARADERAPMGCGHARANLTDGVLDFPPSCSFCAALGESEKARAKMEEERDRWMNRCHTADVAVEVEREAREKAEARVRELEEKLNVF